MDDNNETLELKRRTYRLLFIKPCMSDRTKKMAEARLAQLPVLSGDISLPGYCSSYSAELQLLRLTKGKKSLLVFHTGAVSIRNAEDERDVIETMDRLVAALKKA